LLANANSARGYSFADAEIKEVRFMLGLYYFRWIGTEEEFREYIGRVKEIFDGVEDMATLKDIKPKIKKRVRSDVFSYCT